MYKKILEFILTDLATKYGLTLVKEKKFLPDRKYRFDYAFEEIKVAVEYEGMFSKKSRHLTYTGYTSDVEKYNLALLNGWKVVRVTAVLLANKKKQGNFYDLVEKIIQKYIYEKNTSSG